MYEVMARRYRPATFNEVVGQEHIAATLKNAIARDRVAHAYIFTGGHGCGKTTMARILAKALVCEKGPTPDPCGVCPVCVDVAAGRDSDVLEIDGASNNGIEQIRTLREQAAYVPTRARFKVYIIDEVHMLSDGAFNALLKTLEEPPRHVKFILATTDPHKVPDTVLSRCQRFDFRLVPAPRLAEFFRRLAGEEKAAITDDALDAIAANAEGSVRDGLVLLDQLLSFADVEVTRQDVETVRGVAAAENVAGVFTAISEGDVAAALAVIDEVASRGTNVGDFLDQLVSFGRDLMFLAATGSVDGITAYGPARETLQSLGKKTSLESALLYLDVLAQARTRVRSRALTNPLVALEMAVARLAGLGGVTPVSEILAMLDQVPLDPPARSTIAAAPPPPLPPPPDPVASRPPEPQIPSAPALQMPLPAEPPKTVQAKPEKKAAAATAREVNFSFDPDDYEPDEPDPFSGANEPQLPPELNDDLVNSHWERVLDHIMEKHAADIRHLSRVVVDSVKGGTIVLTGPSTAVEAYADRHRMARLAQAATAVFGGKVDFEFVARSAKWDNSASAADAEAEYKLLKHPAVDRIKSLFDGVIVDCRIAESAAGQEEEQEEES